ncbi:uncharacterized protein [Lolium perenne]|uniref:uncharacterized protein n=1 Tax=Lolium perenne TaxID=4522 RepID=UPI003A9A00A5
MAVDATPTPATVVCVAPQLSGDHHATASGGLAFPRGSPVRHRRPPGRGTHADNIGYQCGGWTIAATGESGRITLGTSILEAIRESVGVETEVDCCFFDKDAVVVVGEVPYAESSGDRTDLSIPFNGSDLITRVASKVPTLVIVISGRPLEIEPQVLEKVDALVAAWLPGSEGMGIADCLFGDYDFVGTLPVTWFRSVDQLPMNVGGSNYDPLFPFGYGLKCSQVMDI